MSTAVNSNIIADLPVGVTPAAEPHRSWSIASNRRRAAFWALVIVLGLLQAWSHRLLVDHDGVQYLDIAENYARGAWSSAINAYYSPLYSWLLALMLLLRLPRSWESTLLHAVNFSGYLGAYASFEFFLRELIRRQRASVADSERVGLSENAWATLGLGIFLYSTLFMANISGSSEQGDGSTPDIFVLLFVFLAAAFLVRMQYGQARIWTYGAFGSALAFGYLAKAAMFPIALVFLAVAAIISLRSRTTLLAFVAAPVCFSLIAGAWIAALSHSTGRYTFGDAGALNFRWEVANRANPAEWGGQTEKDEHLVHPPRQISLNPPVYEFAAPIPGTFPLWYGSAYWLAGYQYHFSRSGQLRVLHEGYNNYRAMLENQKEYLALLFLLLIVQGAMATYFKSFLRQWVLWLPAAAACGLYLLVRVEPRYVAAFLVLLWVSCFAAIEFPKTDVILGFAQCAVIAAVLTTGVSFLHEGLTDFRAVVRNSPSEQFQVADGLHNLGILEGQSLATVGIPHDSYYWARLAGVHVISEIPTPNVNQYWFASPESQEKVRSLFAQAGAVAIVTDAMPAAEKYPQTSIPVSFPGWARIGDTSYFIFRLANDSQVQARQVETELVPRK